MYSARYRSVLRIAIAAYLLLISAHLGVAQIPNRGDSIADLVPCRPQLWGRVVVIADGLTSTDCTTGGATPPGHRVVCICDPGSGSDEWHSVGSGDTSGSIPDPLTVSTVQGSTAAGGTLTLRGTSNSTPGPIVMTASQVTFPAGSAAAPGIAVTGDASTGVYARGSGRLTLAVLGSAVAELTASKVLVNSGMGFGWASSTVDATDAGATLWMSGTARVAVGDLPNNLNGSIDVVAIHLLPGSVGSCGAPQKGDLRVAADGTLCSCNGTSWTATPLGGTCS